MHIGISTFVRIIPHPPMNVGNASIDAENATRSTTHNPRGFSFFDSRHRFYCSRSTSYCAPLYQKRKKDFQQNFTPMPKSKRAWDVYSKTLIHSTFLEGSKGGSWKSNGRFAYQVFCLWD